MPSLAILLRAWDAFMEEHAPDMYWRETIVYISVPVYRTRTIQVLAEALVGDNSQPASNSKRWRPNTNYRVWDVMFIPGML